jgi:transaldolase
MTAASTDNLADLAAAGVSIWLDDLSRSRLTSGNLADLIRDQHVSRGDDQPVHLPGSLAFGHRYDEQVASSAAAGADVDAAALRDHHRRRPRRPATCSPGGRGHRRR